MEIKTEDQPQVKLDLSIVPSLDESCRLILSQRRPTEKKDNNKWYKHNLPSSELEYLNQLETTLEPITSLLSAWKFRYFKSIDLALVHIYYARGKYREVHKTVNLIAEDLPKKLESEIEELWYESNYHIYIRERRLQYKAEGWLDWSTREIKLTPVIRFRLRKRNECPTVVRSGGKKYFISEEARSILRREFTINRMPKRQDKARLAIETGLAYKKVSHWFKNKRSRDKTCQLERIKSSPDYSIDINKSQTSLLAASPGSGYLEPATPVGYLQGTTYDYYYRERPYYEEQQMKSSRMIYSTHCHHHEKHQQKLFPKSFSCTCTCMYPLQPMSFSDFSAPPLPFINNDYDVEFEIDFLTRFAPFD